MKRDWGMGGWGMGIGRVGARTRDLSFPKGIAFPFSDIRKLSVMRKLLILISLFCVIAAFFVFFLRQSILVPAGSSTEMRQGVGSAADGEAGSGEREAGNVEEGTTLDGDEVFGSDTISNESASSIESADADVNGSDGFDADAGDAVETNAFVTHVVDGDTFDVRLDGGEEARVRLLGVNTPETVDPRKPVECFGKEASAFAKAVLNEKRVRLEADPQADERDKYGRLLRNVILEDGTDFNAELVASGYAYAYTFFPLDPLRKREIIALEKQAKAEGVGLWGEGCR